MFGPIKYGIIPQVLNRGELIGGNALVEMGTFVAILAGTIAGPLLMGIDADWPVWVSGTALAGSDCWLHCQPGYSRRPRQSLRT